MLKCFFSSFSIKTSTKTVQFQKLEIRTPNIYFPCVFKVAWVSVFVPSKVGEWESNTVLWGVQHLQSMHGLEHHHHCIFDYDLCPPHLHVHACECDIVTVHRNHLLPLPGAKKEIQFLQQRCSCLTSWHVYASAFAWLTSKSQVQRYHRVWFHVPDIIFDIHYKL